MTAPTVTVPGLTSDEQATANRLLEKLHHHRNRNLLRACYYDGKRAIKQVGSIIPPQYYKLGIVLGWSAKAVDILARRCNLDGFVWPNGDLDSIGMREVWESNHLASEIDSAAISSLIHGPSFLVNTRGEASEGEPASMIHVKDALNATGDWNPRTRRLDNLISISRWSDDRRPLSFTLYLDGETVTASREPGRKWKVERSEHAWGVPAEALVYKPRVGRPFGSSRISRPVMSLHDQALRTVIRMEAHNDIYAIPDLWMFGADESIFKNADGSQKASWQVMMGRIKGVPDDEDADEYHPARAEVKQFAASSPEPHIMSLKQQAQLFSGETSIPLTSLGVSDMSNPTSADSYVASREDLIAEAEGATDDWSAPLRRSIARGLAIANGRTSIPREWATIDTKWRSPMYLSRAAQADAGSKQLSTVPWLAETEVGLELLGLDEQQRKRALSEKRKVDAQGRIAGLAAAAQAARDARQVPVNADADES